MYVVGTRRDWAGRTCPCSRCSWGWCWGSAGAPPRRPSSRCCLRRPPRAWAGCSPRRPAPPRSGTRAPRRWAARVTRYVMRRLQFSHTCPHLRIGSDPPETLSNHSNQLQYEVWFNESTWEKRSEEKDVNGGMHWNGIRGRPRGSWRERRLRPTWRALAGLWTRGADRRWRGSPAAACRRCSTGTWTLCSACEYSKIWLKRNHLLAPVWPITKLLWLRNGTVESGKLHWSELLHHKTTLTTGGLVSDVAPNLGKELCLRIFHQRALISRQS